MRRIPIFKMGTKLDVRALIEKNPHITAAEIARHMNMSVEMVYSDVDFLIEKNWLKVNIEEIKARRPRLVL